MPYQNLSDFAAAQAWERQAEQKKILQQQLFEKQQNEYNRNTVTAGEKAQLDQQQQQYNTTRSDDAERIGGEAIAKGLMVDRDDTELPAGNVSGSSLNANGQAQNQPGLGAENPSTGNGAPGLASILFGKANGSLTPTSATASQGQTGALGQSSLGSVQPSQTGAGQTGHDSGPLPPATPSGVSAGNATPNAPASNVGQTQIPGHPVHGALADWMDRNGKRWATPDEIATNQASIAKQQAEQDRQQKRNQLGAFLQGPYGKDLSDFSKQGLAAEVELGQKLPEASANQMEGEILQKAMDALKSGKMDEYGQLKELLGAHLTHGQNAPAAKMAMKPDGSVYAVTPGVTVDPQDKILGEPGQNGKEPTPIIGFTHNPDGSVKPVTIRGNEASLPSDIKTAAGINTENVNSDKEKIAPVKAANDAKNAYNEASEYAKMENGPGDVALIMQVMSQVKPENLSKIRFNKAEQDFLISARPALDGAQARLDSIRNGNLLGKQERQQYLDMLGTMAHAKAREAGLEPVTPTAGGGTPPPFTDPFPRAVVKGQKIDGNTIQKYKTEVLKAKGLDPSHINDPEVINAAKSEAQKRDWGF